MPVTYDFKGRVAVVTGGANGIGRGCAQRLADAGARVICWDLKPCALEGVASAIVDVSVPSTITAATDAAITAHGRIDILVHSAGYVGPSEPLVSYDPVAWRRLIDVNLIGTYDVIRHVLPHMQRRDWGRIVSIASLAGKEGTPNSSAYSAAKAGVIALTKSVAKEVAMTGIRINCIAPAAVETGLLEQVSKEHLDIMIGKSPMQRLGTVGEVAEMVLWLCSEACTFNSGAVFDLSGGRATY